MFGAASGRALEGVGKALDSFDPLIKDIVREKRADEKFKAGVADDVRSAQMAAQFDELKQQIPNDGAGFHDTVMSKMQETASKSFAGMGDSLYAQRAKAKYASEAIQWSMKATALEREQARTYQVGQITDLQQQSLVEINANPDPGTVDGIRARVNERIDDASRLTPAQKAEAKKIWATSAEATEAAKRFQADPEGMAKALGIPFEQKDPSARSNNPDAVWGRMLKKETNGDPAALSPKGAMGLAQLMPDTAREQAAALGRNDVAQMTDAELRRFFTEQPKVNLEIGRAYFDKMLLRYRGDPEAAAIAYNGGPGTADKWLKSGRDDRFLAAETVDYRNKVLAGDPGMSSRPTASELRLKSGETVAGGDAHFGTTQLARTLQAAVPDLKHFTALNDSYHKGTGSQHAAGLAADFTVNDPGLSAQAAQKTTETLVAAGLRPGTDFQVIDEYKTPSKGATGGHIHVSFNSEDAASRYAGMSGKGNGLGARGAEQRYANLDLSTRLKLVQGAGAQLQDRDQFIKRQEADRAAEAQATQSRRLNELQTEILDGKAGMAQVLAARNDGWLTDAGEIGKLQQAIARRDKQTADIDGFNRNSANPEFVWNPYNAEHKAQVEAGFTAAGGGMQALQAVVDRTAIMPDSGTVMLRGALGSNDPKRIEPAAQVVNAIRARSPNILNGEGSKDLLNAAVEFNHDVGDLGFTAAQAAQRYAERRAPEFERERAKIKSEDVEKEAKALKPGDLMSAFNDSLLPVGRRPDVEFTPELRQQAMADYVELYKELRSQTPDASLAKKQATAQLARVWGTTEINGSKIVTKFPPEKSPVYAGIENLSERMQGQARDSIKALTGLEVAGKDLLLYPISPSAGLRTTTAGSFLGGQPPAYFLQYRDKQGVVQTVQHPYVFDPQELRARQTEERKAGFDAQRQAGEPKQAPGPRTITQAPGGRFPTGAARDAALTAAQDAENQRAAGVADQVREVQTNAAQRKASGLANEAKRREVLDSMAADRKAGASDTSLTIGGQRMIREGRGYRKPRAGE